jgi:signal transduction histidine kinase
MSHILTNTSARNCDDGRAQLAKPGPRMEQLRPSTRIRFGVLSLVLILSSVALGGCNGAYKPSEQDQPVVEFTSVPQAGAGDPKLVSSIKGRVRGAKPGAKIVLYSRGETTWWVQPFANQPITEIGPDSTWKSTTHPGTQYAALLVGPEFNPPVTADALPTDGVYAVAITQGEVPFWLRWWFLPVYVLVVVLALFGFYRLRLLQLTRTMNLRFEERLAERMRVAQELHDTLLQGVISASMQLDVAVDHLPADSPVQPSLRHILQIMGQVIDEGRNTLRGLRNSSDGAHDIELAFLRVPEELGVNPKTAYRVVVEGTARPLKAMIHDEVYSIGREALVNSFRHSGASSIEVELDYGANRMKVLVRDNGCGIGPEVLRKGRDGHWGLWGMRERAERIGAKLKVMSGPSAGTEVELVIPGNIVFQEPPSNGRSHWWSKFRLRAPQPKPASLESEIAK